MKYSICKLLALPMMLCTGMGVLVTGCFSKTKKEEDKPQQYQVVHPVITDTSLTKEYVADIQSLQNVEIRARLKGYIEKVHIDEGQAVKAGQPLFTLSSSEYREDLLKANAQLKAAVAELKSVEVEMSNARLLTSKQIISESEVDMLQAKKDAANAKIDEAKSDIAIAQLNISFTEIKAPFDGFINRIPNKTGSLVDEGALLTSISNNKEVFAYFNLSENDYLDLKASGNDDKSKQVSLVLANGTLYQHNGRIETTESEFDKNTGNLAFRARFPNPEQLLKHGSSGKLLLKTNVSHALLVPQKSTFEEQGNICVYVVDQHNVVQIKKIGVAARIPNWFIVSSGLTPDDNIIYEGIQLVKEGDKVSTTLISPSQFANP